MLVKVWNLLGIYKADKKAIRILSNNFTKQYILEKKMIFKEVERRINFPQKEFFILEFWKENKIFDKTLKKNRK